MYQLKEKYIIKNFDITGDGWTGDSNSLFIIKTPVRKIIKKLKIAVKFQDDLVKVYLFKKKEGSTELLLVNKYDLWSGYQKVCEMNDITLPDGDIYVGVSSPIVVRTDIAPTQAWIADVRDVSSLLNNYTNNTKYGLIMDFSTVEDANVDPGSFEGTDSQKLQAAFDACEVNGGRIIIGRKYNIDSTIIVKHLYEKNNRIIVQGTSSDAQIDVSTTYGFTGVSGSTGGITFKDLKIYCPDPVNTCHAMLDGGQGLHSKTLVNMVFDNCIISNFKFVYYATNYVQSIWFLNCVIRNIKNSIVSTNGYQWYNCNFLNCIIEQINSIGAIGYPEAVNIKNCCIEGSPNGNPIKITGGAKACNIEGNYFEMNGTDIDLSQLNVDIRNIRIIGNYFSRSRKTIVLPTLAASSYDGAITIMNNRKDDTGYLVEGTKTQQYKEVFCAFNSGNITNLPADSLRILKPEDLVL